MIYIQKFPINTGIFPTTAHSYFQQTAKMVKHSLRQPSNEKFGPQLRKMMWQLNAKPIVILNRFELDPRIHLSITLKSNNKSNSIPATSKKVKNTYAKKMSRIFLWDEASVGSDETYLSDPESLTDNIRRKDNHHHQSDNGNTEVEPIVHYR